MRKSKARLDYESRCTELAPGVFRLEQPKGFVHAFYPRWNARKEQFYHSFADKLPALVEAVAWLKVRVDTWPDLMVTLAPLSASMTSHTNGQTLMHLRAIELSPDAEDWIVTLAHEFEHTRQYKTGELDHTRGAFYKGRNYRWLADMAMQRELGRVAFDAYEALPWEADARAFADTVAPALRDHLTSKGMDVGSAREGARDAWRARL